MENTANPDGIRSGIDKEQPVVTDAQSQLYPLPPERVAQVRVFGVAVRLFTSYSR